MGSCLNASTTQSWAPHHLVSMACAYRMSSPKRNIPLHSSCLCSVKNERASDFAVVPYANGRFQLWIFALVCGADVLSRFIPVGGSILYPHPFKYERHHDMVEISVRQGQWAPVGYFGPLKIKVT